MRNIDKVSIKSIKVRPVVLPMQTPHQTASGIITESPLILIDITTSNNIVGHGLLFTYTKAALEPTARFIQNIESLIVNKELNPSNIFEELNKKFRLLGTQGLVGMAIAGIDMALWDALSRELNLSLNNLLGFSKKRVKAYGAIGYDGAKESASCAYEWAQKGFKGVKAKIGYPSLQEDIKVIRAIKDAIGEDVSLMVDYNQSLKPQEAIIRLRALEHENLAWVEEPTLAHDYKAHAKISKEIKTPIQCGENWWGPLDLQHALDENASDYVMLDVMKIGGVTAWMQGAALANTKNIEVSNHLWPEISARLLSCTPTANWLEYCDWWNPILLNPLEIVNGYTSIDDTIGSGIEWNEDIVKQYLI